MSGRPEFVIQLEQASGLPWWCLLLLAVLVLLVIVLSVSLSRARKHARTGTVDIPRGPSEGVEKPADADAETSGEAAEEQQETSGVGLPGVEPESKPAEIAMEEENTLQEPDTEQEAPEEEPKEELAAVPEPELEFQHEPEAKPEVEDDEEAVDEGDPDASPEEATQPESADGQPEEAPEAELLTDDFVTGTEFLDLDDFEILKATGGTHSRMGQSAFGIDFGFLEEYEAEYEHALEEFRRLRNKNE